MEGKIEKINIPLVGVLNVVVFLAFFFAKIYDKIDWNWWWVFSPLWIPIAFILCVIMPIGMIWIISFIVNLINRTKWKL
jgi:hypothetical protein